MSIVSQKFFKQRKNEISSANVSLKNPVLNEFLVYSGSFLVENAVIISYTCI